MTSKAAGIVRHVHGLRLGRRSLLRGAGVALALPWLEAMPARAADVLPRAMFVYFPSGYPRGLWQAASEGDAVVLPPLARALQPFARKLTLVTGLANQPASVGASNAGGIHARGTGCSLVAEPLTPAGFAGAGVSVDQLIVDDIAGASCISSLVLGLPNERVPSFSEEGMSSIFYNNVSFRGPRSPVPKVSNPADLFVRFVTCPGIGTARSPQRLRFERGVMSAIKRKAERLMSQAGREDRLRLEEYFTSVSELERRFLPSPHRNDSATCVPDGPSVPGNTLAESAAAMFDLTVLALRCGLTRVATLMMDGAFSRRHFGLPGLGNANYIHGLSHAEFGGEATDTPRWTTITSQYFSLFASLLARLDAVQEGGGTLLDATAVTFFSEFGDGNAHACEDLPFLIAGSAGGRLRTGQHLRAAAGTPQANAWLALLQAFGVGRDRFGDSTGSLAGLMIKS